MDILNSLDVLVHDSIFENNGPVTVNKRIQFRGHSGGLSVAFATAAPISGRSELTADIRNTIFRNNSVLASVSSRQTTSQLLRQFLITGRGGGCTFIVHSVTTVVATITGCIFERNSALSYGGAMFLAWTLVFNHTVTIDNTSFIENECPGGAGGLEIGFGFSGPEERANKLLASNLTFVRNKAAYGGGAYVFIASEFYFTVCLHYSCHYVHIIYLKQMISKKMEKLATLLVFLTVCLREIWQLNMVELLG